MGRKFKITAIDGSKVYGNYSAHTAKDAAKKAIEAHKPYREITDTEFKVKYGTKEWVETL